MSRFHKSIARPSSGLQDLIRTSAGKDYGYSLTDRLRKNDLPADMHGVHDRSARGGDVYPSSTSLCFFLALCFCVSFSFDAGRCSCAPLFGPADWLHMLACSLISFHGVAYLAAAAILAGHGTGRLIFLSHLFLHCLDRIPKAHGTPLITRMSSDRRDSVA